MNGQLWQECKNAGCSGEPVCVDCQYCEQHCGCVEQEEGPLLPGAEERRRIAHEILRSWDLVPGDVLTAGRGVTKTVRLGSPPTVPYVEEQYVTPGYTDGRTHIHNTVMVHMDCSHLVAGFQDWVVYGQPDLTPEEREAFVAALEIIQPLHWDGNLTVCLGRLNGTFVSGGSNEYIGNRRTILKAAYDLAESPKDDLREAGIAAVQLIYAVNRHAKYDTPLPAIGFASPHAYEVFADACSPVVLVG